MEEKEQEKEIEQDFLSDPFEGIDEEVEESVGTKIRKEIIDLVKIFVVCFVMVYMITTFIAKPVQVDGGSMFPTLADEQIGITNVFSARFQKINRFDVVIIYNSYEHEYWVKRVIGLPGDRIYAKDDKVYVNGQEIDEPYLNTEYVNECRKTKVFTEDFEEIKLTDDEFFLMGDNRIVSHDSRMVGPFHRDDIKGKGIFVLHPFDSLKFVE